MSWFHSKRPEGRLYRKCALCGAEFYLTSIEVSFYLGREISYPDKCRLCLREEEAKLGVINGKSGPAVMNGNW